MILESNLIIPNDKQYTSMSTYIDFEFESSGLIDVNTYILLDLENEFVYSDTIQIQRVNGCGSADITFSVTIPNENILNISVSKSIPKKSTCKIRVTSVTLPTSTRGVNVDGIGQIRIHSLDQIEDNIESYESIKGSSIVKAMILESNLIIPK